MSNNPLLSVDALITGYGKKPILNGVTMNVFSGEVVAIIGHNGAGKSTLLKAIFGLIPSWEGRINLDGTPLYRVNPRELLRSGVAYVPQGNRVFTNMTVRENLEMGGITLKNDKTRDNEVERVSALFPVLKTRLQQKAGTLSGGEKQMLALASALVLSPRLLLLDEPSLGLSPTLISDAFNYIELISREFGAAILIVEQKVREVLRIARRVYVLRNGQVSFAGVAAELNEDAAKLREVYL